jgi:hypothetical protein
VAIAVSATLKSHVLNFTPISDRLATLRLDCRPYPCTVLSCYAPTEREDAQVKSDFYDLIFGCIAKVSKSDILVVAGDFNATLGPCLGSDCRYLGANCIDHRSVRNDNGDRFVAMLKNQDLAAMNTWFRHKRRHLQTWDSNDGRTKKQVDFVCVRNRWKSSVSSCRSYWGTALRSDHAMIVFTMRARLAKYRTPKRAPRLNLEKLADPATRQLFSATVDRKLPAPDDTLVDWDATVSCVMTCVEEVVGRTRSQRKDWISAATLQLVEARKCANSRAVRKDLTAQISHSIDADKIRYWNEQANIMNDANRHGNTGKLFRTLKTCTGSRSNNGHAIRANDGTIIQDKQQTLDRWKEHFEALLNRPPPTTPLFELHFDGPADVSDAPPSLAEVKRAVDSLRSQSAPGEDGITAAMLKAGGPSMTRHLWRITLTIWSRLSLPTRWKKSVLIPLFKKGDKSACKNYRGISLIDVAYKMIEAVILDRLRPAVELYLRENQGGFRAGRSTIDQIFTVRQLVELRSEYGRPLFATFVDFKAAFDSIDRKRMYQILRTRVGLPDRIVSLIEEMYQGSVDVVRVGSDFTDPFPVETGVKQGALLSPILFNIVLDAILHVAMEGCEGIRVDRGNPVTDLDYADDLALLAESLTDMQRMIDRLDAVASSLGLVISAEKTQTMRTPDTDPTPLLLRGQPLADVDKFCYLGSFITMNGDAGPEVRSRIAKAENAFALLTARLWSIQRIDLSTKMRVYLAAVRPVLLYGCETWPMNIEDERRIQAFEYRCWRRILSITYLDRVSNEEVTRRMGAPPLCSVELRRRRLTYLGHVLRRHPDFPARRALLARPGAGWKRPRGKPRTTWQSTVFKDIQRTNPHHVYPTWKTAWKSIISELHRRDWHSWIDRIIAGDGVAFTGRR